ncbi:putative Ribonuclease H-like domain-containing protein [Seiridium cardinale]
MDSSQDFKSTQEKIQAALVKATRTSNSVAAEDLNFQRRSNPAAGEALDEASERLLALSTSLLKSATKGTSNVAPTLEDTDDVDAHWSRIVDVIDTLLEKADTCLDEYTGLVKRKTAPTEEAGSLPKKPKTFTALDSSMRRANILKPQNAFQVKPDNLDTSAWKPLLAQKPHAVLPLEKSLGTLNNELDSTQYDYTIFLQHVYKFPLLPRPAPDLPPPIDEDVRKKIARKQRKMKATWKKMTTVWCANGKFRFKHPYETEILNLKYPDSVYRIADPIKYQPIESTAATFVNTFEGVLDMLAELKKAREIAIDTEHHDFRTYNGLLSLMQISTRDRDWIVDTLQPWRHKLEVLNEVFADPNIVKVLHGAYMDIIWLQRDCGLYIVGLFDTFHAADTLGYPTRSLAYLLKRFVDFDADKKYQMADWRIRPIPEEMFYYARSDTHYLLYIYDLIRNELNEKSNPENAQENLMEHVLERSKDTSLRRYERITYDAESGQGSMGWFNMLMKQSSGNFAREQFAVFRAVHKWRDDLARAEDESPMFIMSNQAIFDVSRRLPPDPKALLSLIPHASHPVKKRISELFKIVEKAKLEGTNGPSLTEFFSEKARDDSNQGIGAVAKQVFPKLRENRGIDAILDTKDLVSEKSQLWGNVPISSRWEATTSINSKPRTQEFALPWATFLENASLAEVQPTMQDVTATQAPTTADEQIAVPTEDAEFTLKLGTKRKATEPISHEESSEEEGEATPTAKRKSSDTIDGDEISVNDDEISINDTSEEEAKERARRKAAKKARKERQRDKTRASRAEGEQKQQPDEAEEPFDYSKAKPVLNAKKGAADGVATGGKGKVFNPYAKLSAEGPKPGRRMHGEKPGKSATFKKL